MDTEIIREIDRSISRKISNPKILESLLKYCLNVFLQEPLKGFKRLKSDRRAHVEIYFAHAGGLWSTLNDQ